MIASDVEATGTSSWRRPGGIPITLGPSLELELEDSELE